MVGIYKITNPKGRIYIGQSNNIERRFKDYKRSLKKQQIRLYNSIKNYGYENHKFEVIEECSINLLNERERYWQDYYDVIGRNGLNCRLTECNDRSGVLSKETIDKLKNKNFDYLIGNKFRKGIKHTDEIKEQIRQTLILNAKKPDYKNPMSGKFKEKNHFYGKKHTEKTKQIIREKALANNYLIEKLKSYNLSRCYVLLNTETGIYYESISEASKLLSINYGTLKQYLSGKIKNKTNLIKV